MFKPSKYLKPNKIPAFVKVFTVIVLICLPIAVMWMVLTPIARSYKHRPKQYKLSQDFTRAELFALSERLKVDPEFSFYYAVLSPALVSRAVSEVYSTLGWQKSKEEMLQTIQRMQKEVEVTAKEFEWQVSSAAAAHTAMGDQRNLTMWAFIYEEFKLALAGVCYRVTYDNMFFFVWSQEVQQTAYRVRRDISAMADGKRTELAQLFLQTREPAEKAR